MKSRSNVLFLIKPLSTPNSASISRNVFSARGLVTSMSCGGSTYSTGSAMFVTGIIRLFRSNCPRGVQKYCLITPIFRNCQKNSGEASVGLNLQRKEWKVLSCLICLMGTYSVYSKTSNVLMKIIFVLLHLNAPQRDLTAKKQFHFEY